MQNKIFKVEFTDGNQYGIPANVIAEHYANYYAVKGGYDKESPQYKTDFELCLNDDDLITDYAANNLDWIDLVPYARLIQEGEPVNYTNDWNEGETTFTIENLDDSDEEE